MLTGDARRPVIEDGVVAIAGNRIAALGTRAEFPAAMTAPTVLDLAGRVITPGFVNVHTHAVLSLMRGIALDMGFVHVESGPLVRSSYHAHETADAYAAAAAQG